MFHIFFVQGLKSSLLQATKTYKNKMDETVTILKKKVLFNFNKVKIINPLKIRIKYFLKTIFTKAYKN